MSGETDAERRLKRTKNNKKKKKTHVMPPNIPTSVNMTNTSININLTDNIAFDLRTPERLTPEIS